MPARKILFSALLCVLFLWVFSCFFASSCLAAVVINEFCPKPNSGEKEWIEFYNPENIDLSNWIIEEKTSTGNITQHIIRNNENLINNPIFDVFTFSSYKLNDKGDEIKLFNKKNKKVDEHSYSETERGISFARIPDGGNWSTSNPPTKGSSNGTSIPSNPSSPPSPSPDSTSVATAQTAAYKINEVKDKNGNLLNSVKVYIDEVYTHHYTPELYHFAMIAKMAVSAAIRLS